MKKRFFVLIFAVLILITIVSCSDDSDSPNENFIDALNNLDLSEDNQTETDFEEVEEIEEKLIKIHDEKHDRYNFAYKRSELSIRKEVFDEYNLTDRHIQKFFEIAETVYDKLTEFFFEHNLPEIFIYHAIPSEFSEPDLYDDYSYRLHSPHSRGGVTIAWIGYSMSSNESYYREDVLANYLSMIDTGFPSLVIHELAHFLTLSLIDSHRFIFKPYVWDEELFSELAVYYLASELTVVNNRGEILTAFENQDFNWNWNKFFSLADKYGYYMISDTLKEMTATAKIRQAAGNYTVEYNSFDLFKEVLSRKTGDDIEDYFTPKAGETANIRGILYDTKRTSIGISSVSLKDSDIEELRYMVNLTGLSLNNNQITDISVLAGLSSLISLSLHNNQISDISALAGLKNLKDLALHGNQVSDISVLAELKNLEHLSLNNNQITDISVLAGLSSLISLSLYNNQVSDISVLAELKNLEYLTLDGNPFTAEQIAELREALPNTWIYTDY